MSAGDLIKVFSTCENLPIDVNDVLRELKAGGCEDDIEFIGVDFDTEILQGKIKVFHLRDGLYGAETRRCVNIYYHRGHDPNWQRLIACKELLHVLDPDWALTNTIGDIERLAEKIGLPPEMQDPQGDGLDANVDRLAEWRAAALLLPLAARDLLMPAYKEGKISLAQIAILADIPRKYVAFVMMDTWPSVHALLVK